ncbi:Adenylate/guanylate cyclase domain-containing response regulator [Planctomycetales bacterium 10988]|nr:Adenylate/guanylate cyclase domain-containing response regulator [Planctomycetales bacterium 10988]
MAKDIETTGLSVEAAQVLIADDSSSSREILERILIKEGHQVTLATTGKEALSLLSEREFDLVFLDLVMPEMTGFDALSTMKADNRLQHTPVIMVSSLDTVQEVASCIEIGADDFLTKPVDHRLLKARVNSSLERKRLREREFGQFFTPELARYYVRHPELLKQGSEEEVSILFCDIRSFSRISERLGPSDTVKWLGDVMDGLSECVLNHRGVLVDFIGDELMAMWGAPESQPNHAELACQAAIDMLKKLPRINRKWRALIGEEMRVGIGINTGPALVGNTGSQRKFKYGALGNTVNLASRVQGATKHLKTDLLVTGETFAALSEKFSARRLCTVRVVNIERPVVLYEVLTDFSIDSIKLKDRYELALAEFEQQRFREAASILGNLLVEYPQHGPTLQLMARVIDALLNNPTPFDPISALPGK